MVIERKTKCWSIFFRRSITFECLNEFIWNFARLLLYDVLRVLLILAKIHRKIKNLLQNAIFFIFGKKFFFHIFKHFIVIRLIFYSSQMIVRSKSFNLRTHIYFLRSIFVQHREKNPLPCIEKAFCQSQLAAFFLFQCLWCFKTIN